MNTELSQASKDYYRIEKALSFLQKSYPDQPKLEDIAKSCGLSPFHFQRVFTRWVGISPKRFLQFLTVEYAKRMLADSRSILDTTYDSGLSSPSRLHDLFVSCEAMTPGEYKQQGKRLTIRYGIHPSPFGECVLAVTDRGICALEFVACDATDEAIGAIRRAWSKAEVREDSIHTNPYIARIFRPHEHKQKSVSEKSQKAQSKLNLFLKGTNFQIKVWQALLRIPQGCIVSYRDIAHLIGNPRATRAVAGAIARNPIGYIIPCHRVIRSMGVVGGYRWGTTRKRAILGWEQVHRAAC
jgi:AraC family transcriptional regulator of adaptative response/methylated-DNA-[protein]-cysteine methyltransferase